MGEVVGLRNCPVAIPRGAPVPGVARILEELLVEAKSGNLRSIAVAYVIDDGTDYPHTSYQFEAEPCRARLLENSIARMVRAFGSWLDNE